MVDLSFMSWYKFFHFKRKRVHPEYTHTISSAGGIDELIYVLVKGGKVRIGPTGCRYDLTDFITKGNIPVIAEIDCDHCRRAGSPVICNYLDNFLYCDHGQRYHMILSCPLSKIKIATWFLLVMHYRPELWLPVELVFEIFDRF